jgi:flagellar hook-associated protein 1 FlgK
MADFSIGLSGLTAVQKAINIIGNNIANAASDGYHKQIIDLAPAYFSSQGSITIGGGVVVQDVRRSIDTLLEQEIYRQQSVQGALVKKQNTLETIENAFGEFTTKGGGLGSAIDTFFSSLQDLTLHPNEQVWLNQFVSEANAMVSQFRTLGEYLTDLQMQIRLESSNIVGTINTYAKQIAELNDKIEAIELVEGNANAMCDQRDQLISQLSNLIGIETINRAHGVVDVAVGGIPLVTGSAYSDLELGFNDAGKLGVTIRGGTGYTTDVNGGQLGGLLDLSNDIISDIQDSLDLLASTIIKEVNRCHVQGVGVAGSFDNLVGWANVSGDLADFEDITSGYVYMRVINTEDGSVTRTAIPVMQDASSDSLADIVAYINANVPHVIASVNSSNQLSLTSDTGYKFDFLPASFSSPLAADTNFNGTVDPEITISGSYSGEENDRLTFTVIGSGQIGNDDNLKILVTNSGSEEVATVNIGVGYSPGDKIQVGNTGLFITLNSPSAAAEIADLANGDSFSVDVFNSSDTSGLLAAIGLNTFFSGSSATDIAICDDIVKNPGRTATAIGANMNDNDNITRMLKLQDEGVSRLGNLSCGEFYRQLVTEIGQDLSIAGTQIENVQAMLVNLTNQQSEISGVNVNEESAQLLVYQQMFQSIAKYMMTINETLKAIMEII